MDLQHWVNEGLMTFFFLVVGLEIKREVTSGRLREPRTLASPVIAAVGGMVVPATIYLILNPGGETASGWGISVATDIAFALGVLTFAASRAPESIRSFLLTLAIVDDIGAVLVIAVFYSGGIEMSWLLIGACAVGTVLLLRYARVVAIGPYVVVGIVLWVALREAGIHPTIAGVLLGFLTPAAPLRPARSPVAPLDRVEHAFHPWTSRVVMPLFALANAGVSLAGPAISEAITSPVGAGVFLGLLVGKPAGILGATWVATRTGIGRLPDDITGTTLSGAAVLAGIGFTVSLFVTDLAFEEPYATTATLAVLGASLIAGILGALILRVGSNRA